MTQMTSTDLKYFNMGIINYEKMGVLEVKESIIKDTS
jgi:hypothetical protein